MSSRIDFKTQWPRNGHADSLGVKLTFKIKLDIKITENLAKTVNKQNYLKKEFVIYCTTLLYTIKYY